MSLKTRLVERLYRYATTFCDRGDFRHAEVAYQVILWLSSDERTAFDRLLGLYKDAAHIQPALNLARQWLSRHPEDISVYGIVGELALDLGDLSAAEALHALASSDPRSPLADYLADQIARHEGAFADSTSSTVTVR
ncbi:hypothetical protein V5E97_19230 [Singulisphaera sp. Ch08]|uniref:Tetratricopeptide repeat protein n=1 Tax=Singulisphaera sp. Ch08 TaxID=3120278 RepID=A0AAU7CSS6_9BACT